MAESKHPNRLRFNLNAEQVSQLCTEVIASASKMLDNIVKIPSAERTFRNTVRALSDYEGEFTSLVSSCTFPKDVSTDKIIREAATEASKKLEAFSIEMDTREDLYQAVVEYKNNNQAEIAKLSSEEKRLLAKIVQSFERNGLALPKEKRDRVKDIKTKISELSIKYQQNLNEDATKVYFTREELDGLPSDFLDNLPTVDDEVNGAKVTKYQLTLKYPEFFPVMEQATNEQTRKTMDYVNGTKCVKENTQLLEEIILLRQEEAKLLGFDCHANYILDVRMAKNADTVLKFLKDLTEKLDQPSKREIARLLELKKKDTESRKQPFDGKFNSW